MADGGKKKHDNNDHILYNLLVHAEWNLEGEILNKDRLIILQQRGSLGKKLLSVIEGSLWTFWKFIKYPFSGLGKSCALPKQLVKLSESPQTWDLSLSSDGKFLAVLQEQWIEIRSARDNFSSVLSKCQVLKDPYPKWRKLSWSMDTSLLAFAYSSGEVVVYDLSGTALCSLKDNITSNVYSGSCFRHSDAIAGLFFMKRDDGTDSSMELVIISYQGYLRSYLINGSSGDHRKNTTFSFQSVLPDGVSSAVYCSKLKLLVLGSPGAYPNQATSETSALANGITFWRLLSDHPHYKLIEDQALDLKQIQKNAGFLGKFLSARSRNKQSGVWKMSLGLDDTALLVLHYSGKLSLWELPSLRLKQSWRREEQPEYKNADIHHHFPSFGSVKDKGREEKFLYDIGWWSNEAVVLAWSSGAVTVSTIRKSLQNILGQFPEWCEPLPLITSAHDGGFLILECENAVVSPSPIRKTIVCEGEKELHEEDEEDEEHHIITKTKELTKHFLYFLTESERFRPPVRRPKILKQTYRLLCLRSTTPEELYARKIELEEYGEALALAQTYDLDCDLVYQKQWRKSKVTVSSIHDYLSKVTKRIWVLHECLERVPEDLDSTKTLLKYGLHGTDVYVLTALGKKGAEHPFVKEECDGLEDEEEERSERDNEKKLLRSIDFENLSVEQRNICRYRLRFLKYLDRLSTYETILGGCAVAHDAFDCSFFTTFRDSNIVETTVDFARDNDWNAVDCLLTYHGHETIPHYLAILSNFPETTIPFSYRSILPEAGVGAGEPDVYKWEQKSWRTKDWVENPLCLEKFEEPEEDPGEFLYVENSELRQFRGDLNSKLLTEWYQFRAHEIERTSSQVDNALELIKLGKERGVKGLVSLHDDLVTLSDVVYECRGEGDVDLESLQKLNNLGKMKLLVSKSTEQSFIKDFKKWVIPFLERVEKRNRGSKVKLIQQYVTETAKVDLTYPLKILEQSSSEVNEPFIPDVARQMKLTIDCIYLCSRDDQLNLAASMLKCMPSRVESILSDQILQLHNKMEQVEVHLQGARTLSENGFPKPVSFLLDNEANQEAATSIMTNLSKIARDRQPPLKRTEWDKLLADMLDLRDKIFTCISRTVCYQACAESLLGSGNKENINHAGQLLCRDGSGSSRGGKVGYEKSVEMVVTAAREYFNSANDVKDPCMALAKACLELIWSSEPCVKEELNLITALSMLSDFNISILPLQVRLCQDKAELIEKALDSSPLSYKDPGKLLHLASLLQLSGSDDKTRRGRVLSLVAERALQCDDLTVAYGACAEIMKSSFIPGWKICRTLGQNTAFANLKARRKLLDFSLTYCEPNAVETLLRSRSLLQTEILYGEISELMAKIGDTVDSGELSTTGKISKTTKTIISSVSDVGWWKNTLQWVRPLHRTVNEGEQEEMASNEQPSLHYCCNPFYDSVHRKLQPQERKFQLGSDESEESSMRISELLLQTQKLAEERAEGSIEEPATEVLIQLASHCLNKDSSLSLAYLLALPEFTNAYECFEKLPSCSLTLQLATYYYALQVYNEMNPQVLENRSSLYLHPPDYVIDHVMECFCAGQKIGDDVKFLMTHLKRYHTQLSDFSQAKLLQELGRGVDISRFTQDEEYKRETILGLTMSTEDDIFNTAISLAERYDISKWEMFMSHLEWLFTDSSLSTKQLQDRVNEKRIMQTLLEQPEKVITRLKEYIYPSIDGKQLARLLYYYMLFYECVQKGETTHDFKGDSDPQTHVRLIKKIKAASPGIDYKKLMDGDDPLEALRPYLVSTNVHVFAKMANKIRLKTGLVLSPSKIFKAFAEKVFWEGEGKLAGKEVDWIHRYEVVHGYLERLSFQDMIDLIDSLTFSEKAVDTLTLDVRDDIIKRALKFSRQLIGRQRKKSKNDQTEGSVTLTDVTQHFEQSQKHLASLDCEIMTKLYESDQDEHVHYARLYDLSRSEPKKIKELCAQVLCNGDSLQIVEDILDLSNQQCGHGLKTKDVLKESLRILLKTYSHPDERPPYLPGDVSPLDLLKRFLDTSQHRTEGSAAKKLIKDEDILEEVRPFCADDTVPPEVKPEVLQLLEKFIHLTGEDRILLLYHQTNAIVRSHWDITLKTEDVESNEKRLDLFARVFNQTVTHKQTLSLASLLEIWPPLEDRRGGESAWYLVLTKLITDAQDGMSVVKLVREEENNIDLDKKDCQRILDALFQNSNHLLFFKFGLLLGDHEMFQLIVNEMKEVQPDQKTCDNELLELIFKRRLSSHIVHTHFFSVYVKYMLLEETSAGSSREFRVNQVINDLHEAGFTVEAASIRTSLENLHPALRTFDTTLGAFFKWMANS